MERVADARDAEAPLEARRRSRRRRQPDRANVIAQAGQRAPCAAAAAQASAASLRTNAETHHSARHAAWLSARGAEEEELLKLTEMRGALARARLKQARVAPAPRRAR